MRNRHELPAIISDKHGSVRVAGVRVDPLELDTLKTRFQADRAHKPGWRLRDIVRRGLRCIRARDAETIRRS